ncbi:MAG: hypothetical protein K6C97_00860 [Treponema sp.]|nr:hypothetical protein [Treponema sp.]
MKKLILLIVMGFSVVFVFAEKNLAVATFDISNNAVTKDEAEAITELYITELVATGKVNIIDRVNFDKILKEMNFQNSDWSDSGKTTELGKVINADYIARGQIIKLGSKMYLSATIIDVKTAKVLSSARKEFESLDDIFGLLTSFANDAIAGLTLKIGDTGPGGGIVFYIGGQNGLECSSFLGEEEWMSAISSCEIYNGGGFNDWYLPSVEELLFIYENLIKTNKMAGNGKYLSSNGHDGYPNAVNFGDGVKWWLNSGGKFPYLAVRKFIVN